MWTNKFSIKTYVNNRRGRFCVVPTLIPGSNAKVCRKIEASLPTMATDLFNTLPLEIRNFEGSVKTLKGILDKLFMIIPKWWLRIVVF